MFVFTRLCLPLLLCALSASAGSQQLTIDASLEPLNADEWQISYEISPSVSALVFVRGNGDYRRETWVPDDDAFVLERVGRTDRIRRADNRPFTEFSARLTPWTDKPTSDYTPFVTFSDGTMAAFTGQFVVGVPITDDDAAFVNGASPENAIGAVAPRITVEPGYFGRMIVNAEVTNEATQMNLFEGEYVYFGGASAVQTATLTAVTDEAAPEWLRTFLYDSMTKTYEYFTYRLGEIEGDKPFMIAAYRPLEGNNVSFIGGVVGSQLVVELGLGTEVADTPDSREFMVRFFAHESAHLWHRGGGIPAGGGGSWVHEGSADALAWLGLVKLDIYTPDIALALFIEAANNCVAHLADGPLAEAGRRGASIAYYDCGAIISLATHSIMREQGRDLFDFWRQLLNSGAGQDDFRVDYYYFQAGRASPGFDGALMEFVEATHEDEAAAIVEVLQAGGVAAGVNDAGQVVIAALP